MVVFGLELCWRRLFVVGTVILTMLAGQNHRNMALGNVVLMGAMERNMEATVGMDRLIPWRLFPVACQVVVLVRHWPMGSLGSCVACIYSLDGPSCAWPSTFWPHR